jgi:hypothetical protein
VVPELHPTFEDHDLERKGGGTECSGVTSVGSATALRAVPTSSLNIRIKPASSMPRCTGGLTLAIISFAALHFGYSPYQPRQRKDVAIGQRLRHRARMARRSLFNAHLEDGAIAARQK